MGLSDDTCWPVWILELPDVRRFRVRQEAGMDSRRQRDYPICVASTLIAPNGEDVAPPDRPTCCTGLAFIRGAFVYHELRPLSPDQELHRRFWSLLSGGASLTGALFLFHVERYVSLEEARELPSLRKISTLFFKGPSEFCHECLQSLLTVHGDAVEPDCGLIDVCHVMPRSFAAKFSAGGSVVSACELGRQKDELSGCYSYRIGWSGRFRNVSEHEYDLRCLLALRESFEPTRFIARSAKFFEDRPLASGEAANRKFEYQIGVH